MTTSTPKVKKQVWIMLIIVMGMFGFGFALVPLYSVFCKATGLNGKTPGQVAYAQTKVDLSRSVTVELIATLNDSLPPQRGEFKSTHKKFTLHPGEYVTTSFWVKNLTPNPMTVQAIPSVTPGLAAQHIKKVECFCFINQGLNPLEGKDMRLVFTVSPELPTSIHTMTLAYTLFDVTPKDK